MKRNEYDVGFAPPEPIVRPRCPNCHDPLRPIVRTKTQLNTSTHSFDVTSRRWLGQYHGYGHFCSLRCCESFANAAYMAGYKRT